MSKLIEFKSDNHPILVAMDSVQVVSEGPDKCCLYILGGTKVFVDDTYGEILAKIFGISTIE